MRHQPAHMSRDTNVDDSRCAPPAEPEPANSGRLTPARLTARTPYECSQSQPDAYVQAKSVPASSSHRSGEGAFESGAVGGLAVGRQHELQGLVEQRPQPTCDLLDRDAFRQPPRGDLEPIAQIDQRIAGDYRVNPLAPEHEIEMALTTGIRLHPEQRDADRVARPGKLPVLGTIKATRPQ